MIPEGMAASLSSLVAVSLQLVDEVVLSLSLSPGPPLPPLPPPSLLVLPPVVLSEVRSPAWLHHWCSLCSALQSEHYWLSPHNCWPPGLPAQSAGSLGPARLSHSNQPGPLIGPAGLNSGPDWSCRLPLSTWQSWQGPPGCYQLIEERRGLRGYNETPGSARTHQADICHKLSLSRRKWWLSWPRPGECWELSPCLVLGGNWLAWLSADCVTRQAEQGKGREGSGWGSSDYLLISWARDTRNTQR